MTDKEPPDSGVQLSPMMRQFWDVKTQYPDALLFFRVGDFYELFDADAQVAARELDITLTGRPEPSYQGGRVPMAGVPYRAAEVYLSKLIARGYSVAICEQVGVVGAGRGPIERQVTRVLTPGTVLESTYLPSRENNYLVSILRGGGDGLWGLAYVDASCGEFSVTQLTEQQLVLEVGRLNPREVLAAKRTARLLPGQVVPQEVLDLPEEIKGRYRVTGRPAMFFQFEPSQRRIMQLFGVSTLEGFGCDSMPLAVGAAGAVVEYLEKTQGALMPKFSGISTYCVDGHLVLDPNTRKNLELTETSRDRSFEGSLLWALDQTKTGMGSRTLRKWLLKPLYSVPEIKERQDAVSELVDDLDLRQSISRSLAQLCDLERLGVKLSSGTILPKELVSVGLSLADVPVLAACLENRKSRYLSELGDLPAALTELKDRISNSLQDDAPRELTDGGIFKTGYSSELDEVRELLGGGKQWVEQYQKKEQERTGIRSLRVNFNQTFGYYIEVTHANKDSVPAEYIRKQTLTNAERFITPELKEYEAKILNAEKNQGDMEYKLFLQLRKELMDCGSQVYLVAQRLAALDAILSLSEVAVDRRYVRPVVDESLDLEIKNGRHPVLEKILPMGRYVSNDTLLCGNSDANQLVILTGPNMSGKSSFLRQVALIVLLAQIGSYVPAESATVGLVDRIFTRIGAVDDLTQGQSSFLVDMSETTQCCLSATTRSLVLLDEVGRGTSTYDGVAIAWSVSEYLAQQVRARTIFATHYHELNGLANFFPQISNFQVLVRECGDHVEFIRSVVPGGASRSFGIQVARMAGLPSSVIERAQLLMGQMERRSAASKILDGPKFRTISMDEVMQLSLFKEEQEDGSASQIAGGSKSNVVANSIKG